MRTIRNIQKILVLLLISSIYVPSLYAQGNITVARRMKVAVADFETPGLTNAVLTGKASASELERQAFTSSILLENLIIKDRNPLADKLSGLKIGDINALITRARSLGLEGIIAGTVKLAENGSYTIEVQLIDAQEKNIPSTRRILNYAEIRDVPDTADGLIAAVSALVKTMEKGVFPRVDIITPNFDVVSIISINKDAFPEIKLRVSVVNKNGDPVSIPAELFEVRENGNMCFYNIKKLNSTETMDSSTALTLLFAIDRSPSMLEEVSGVSTGKPFQRAKDAMADFLTKLSPDDQVKIVAFDYTVLPLGDYTRDKASYLPALQKLTVGRGTGLYNIVKFCAEDAKDIKGERAVILLTDGKNDVRNASADVKAVTLEQGLEIAKRYTVPIYSIGFGGADEATLSTIAKETHSQYFKASTSEELRALYLKLHKIIENQYIISYKSFAEKFGKVNVSLNIHNDERSFSLSDEEQLKGENYRNQSIKDKDAGALAVKEVELKSREDKVKNEKAEIQAQLIKLEAEKTTLNAKGKDLEAAKAILLQREEELKRQQATLAAERASLEQQKIEIMKIQQNIRTANQEILDYLKNKMDYIKQEEDKLKTTDGGK